MTMTASLLPTFTHLRVHSHYSLLRGAAAPEQLAERAAGDGLRRLALTDTGALYGAVAFGRACKAAGITPIIGLVIPIAAPAGDAPVGTDAPGELALLAQNPAGYRSLCRLATLLQAEPERERWRQTGLPWRHLQENEAGLLCLSGGRRGWLERYLRAGEGGAAGRFLARLGGIFPERAYLSLELGAAGETAVTEEAITLGARFGLRPAAAQPVYCLDAADRTRLRLLAAIRRGCPLEMVPDTDLPASGHWLSPEEMAARYAAYPEALTTAGEIADRCGPCLPDGETIWPALKLPDGQGPEVTLREQAETGLKNRYGEEAASSIRERLNRELAAINRVGFAPFFLLAADVTRFARERDIPVNTRGSVANSLVAYCLQITAVDPIAHDLLFERFLSPARSGLPDIDLDVCSRRRDEALRYLREKYGAERVALVATVSTMRPKSAVAETGKAYGLAPGRIKALSALVPSRWHPDPRRRQGPDAAEIVSQLTDEREQDVVKAAFSIVGQPHHLSIHPGGVVVTPGPLTDVVPLQLAPKGFLTTQYPHDDLAAIGLPKLDLLGIRALTVLADAAELIRTHHDPAFRLAEIPETDEETAVTLRTGDTVGVFQCESSGARRTLRQLAAETVADLAAANAFFKPGPATGGMAAAFVRRYRGEEKVTYLHPALEPILAPTQGVLLFQEQILRLATEIAGLSWAQADQLRKGMSKFKPRQMAALRLDFERGCRERSGFTADQAATLWEQVAAFAGYGFNRGHATAYAGVSYRSVYLKTHWPAEFLCARLIGHGGFHHPAVYIAEAQRLGVAVRPPHVNASGRAFTLTYETEDDEKGPSPTLWMGLGAVRQLRRRAAEAILAKRPFRDLTDLLSRVALREKEIRYLIQCGALDGLGESRAALLAAAETAGRAGSPRQMAFDFARETAVSPETAAQRIAWEKHVLGQPLSVHPVALVERPSGAIPIAHLSEQPANSAVRVIGAHLPGWTGGRGFFLGDGEGYVVVKGVKKTAVSPWEPILVGGHWRRDAWGGTWLEARQVIVP